MTSSSEGARLGAPVDDGFFADVRGEQQWITLRGADAANPPLPGAVESARAALFLDSNDRLKHLFD